MIDNSRFWAAHEVFLQHVQANTPEGEPFQSFDHPFLRKDETAYKRDVFRDGKKALRRDEWRKWRARPGKILDAVREACSGKISQNLLEHRYGHQGNSDRPLYVVGTDAEIEGLEEALFALFCGGGSDREAYGPRFDLFADYLRNNHLGCKWEFVSYLSFLLDDRRYFPIRSGAFERVLHYYKIPIKVAGRVSWQRYSVLLDLADEAREKLATYGPADAIEIQSYLWVVSYLLKDGAIGSEMLAQQFDPQAELEKRQKAANERERIGLLGEALVLQVEAQRLREAGRPDLAQKVRVVSAQDASLGYDLLSFTDQGKERHIEVKTTARPEEDDAGLWLTELERAVAEGDDRWTLYRVWEIYGVARWHDFGNVIRHKRKGWRIDPATWYFRPIALDSE